MTRRHALLLAGSAAAPAQPRLAPGAELVNTFEMEQMARQVLAPPRFAEIEGSHRAAFDRITLRPRLMVDTTGLDLSLDLFGTKLFAPILVGPAAKQGRYHPEAERALLEGATKAKTAVVLASETTVPLTELTPKAETPIWLQIDPASPTAPPPGAKAYVITLTGGAFDWSVLNRLNKGIPIVIKGIMTAAEARAAVERGAQGIIVSNYRNPAIPGLASAIEVLPSIAAEIGNKVPILIDGSFRRGSDILKALALGAKAVLVARPPLWGLSAYGAKGVQQVLEQLQTELARDMAMCGAVTLSQLTPALVKIHRR